MLLLRRKIMVSKNKVAFVFTGLWLMVLVWSHSITLGASTTGAAVFGWVLYPIIGFKLIKEILCLMEASSKFLRE